jgi:hypothetical protein
MINISKKDLKEIKKLSEILKNHGIFIINNYLLKKEVSELKEEVLHYHKIIGNSYPFGSNYSINNPKELPDESFQKTAFSNSWMKELFLDYNNNISKGFFDKVYSTHDYKFDGTIGRNGYLHFDRNSSLKFFLYLNDVNEDNGAFYIQIGSHKLGKKLREKAWGNFIPLPVDSLFKKILNKTFGTNFKNVKNRLELDYPEFFEPNKLVPVEGKAGTLIVFDSDIFHQGGKINIQGKERVVLRSHNYLSV